MHIDIYLPPKNVTVAVRRRAQAVVRHSKAVVSASEQLNVKVDHLIRSLPTAVLFLAQAPSAALVSEEVDAPGKSIR
jgi:hypothetical protein